jgi:hypothetical protein
VFYYEQGFIMNDETLLQPIHNLLIEVKALLVLAQAAKWDELNASLESYQVKLNVLSDKHYLQTIKDNNLNLEAQGIILQIQGFNAQVDELAECEHTRIASELRQMMQSDKALDAYSR